MLGCLSGAGYIGDDAGIFDGSVGMSEWSWDAYMVIVKCLRELLSKSVLRGEFGPGNGQVV